MATFGVVGCMVARGDTCLVSHCLLSGNFRKVAEDVVRLVEYGVPFVSFPYSRDRFTCHQAHGLVFACVSPHRYSAKAACAFLVEVAECFAARFDVSTMRSALPMEYQAAFVPELERIMKRYTEAYQSAETQEKIRTLRVHVVEHSVPRTRQMLGKRRRELYLRAHVPPALGEQLIDPADMRRMDTYKTWWSQNQHRVITLLGLVCVAFGVTWVVVQPLEDA